MRNRFHFSAKDQTPHHRTVTPDPARRGKAPSNGEGGRCVLLSDGRILTVAEARRQYLKDYWAN